jgi:HK97 family phage major capsid protein
MKYIKELLSTGIGTVGTLLIPQRIYDTLIDEAEKALIPRSEAALVFSGFEGPTFNYNLITPNTLKVRVVGEGAEIPIDQAEQTTSSITPLKWGVSLRITREMLEDAQWNMLETNLKIAGRRFAENETNLILTALDGAANTVAGGAAVTIANITRAIQYLRDADYNPTTLFIGNEVLYDLQNIDTFVEADKAGDTEMLRNGYRGRIFGLNVLNFSTNAAPSTTYTKYAYVTDRENAYVIAEKRPISVERFELPQYDQSAAAITQRIKVNTLRTSAICNITSS